MSMRRYCPNCGTELKRGASFYPNCGQRYDLGRYSHEDEADDEIEEDEGRDSDSESREKKKTQGIVFGLVAFILAALVLNGFLNQRPYVIRLNSYLEVAYEGADGSGTAKVVFDRISCERDMVHGLLVKREISEEDGQELLGRLAAGNDLIGADGKATRYAENIELLMSDVLFSADKLQGLSNGDTLSVRFFCRNEAEESLHIRLEGKEESYKVSGLTGIRDLASDISDISSEIQEQLIKRGEEEILTEASLLWPRELSLEKMTYEGYVLLNVLPGEKALEAGNLFYQVFRVEVSVNVKINPDEGELNNEIPYTDRKIYYTYVRVKDITGKETEGETEEQKLCMPQHSCELVTELVDHGEPVTYRFTGYDSLRELFWGSVRSRLDLYSVKEDVLKEAPENKEAEEELKELLQEDSLPEEEPKEGSLPKEQPAAGEDAGGEEPGIEEESAGEELEEESDEPRGGWFRRKPDAEAVAEEETGMSSETEPVPEEKPPERKRAAEEPGEQPEEEEKQLPINVFSMEKRREMGLNKI